MKQTAEIKKPFDLAKAEAEMAVLQEVIQKKQDACRAREKEIFEFLAGVIVSNCKIQRPNTGVKVHISSRRLDIRYYYDLEKHNSVEIDVTFAEKWDVYEWNDTKKASMEKLGIQVGDIYEMKFRGVNFNIAKAGYDEVNDVMDYLNMCQYLAKDFHQKENGYFFNKAKTFLNELLILWEDISHEHSKRNKLHREREEFLFEEYKKEFSAPGVIKEGSVILLKKKKTDFECMSVYAIKECKRVLYKMEHTEVDVTHMHYDRHYTEEYSRYHMKINNYNRDDDKKFKIESLISELAKHKVAGDEIEIVDMKYWEDYRKLLDLETENISQSTQEEFLANFAEKSKYYEGIYSKKNK